MRRVFISGIGIAAPTGLGVDAFWDSCRSDRAAAAEIPATWHRAAPLRSNIWAPLPPVPEMPDIVGRIEAKQLDPVTMYALFAVFEAVRNAGLAPRLADEKHLTYRLPEVPPERASVFLGTGVGGISTVGGSFAHQLLSAENDGKPPGPPHPKRFNPFTVSMLMPNSPAAVTALKLGATGPCRTLCMACASGTAAVGQAFRAVSEGETDLAIAGGAEYLYDHYGTIFRAFDELRTLAHGDAPVNSRNRPFDAKRSGFLFSQGAAAALTLEPEDAMRKRDAKPVAEISAYAESCDASSLVMMDRTGHKIERMLRSLLNDAGSDPASVDYINAHGTGTELNDAVESEVIGRVFRPDVAVNTSKALIGHSMGAAGAVEAAVCALSLRDQFLHGLPNLDEPIAPLSFVRRAGAAQIDTAVSQSFGFGGHNTALLLRRFKGFW